jgi:ABC-type Mn2+/Zn2+ transport system ATPase subunit
VTGGDLDVAAIVALTQLLKSAHGLATAPKSVPLSNEHIAVAEDATAKVSLRRLTHHVGVNALAPEQTVSFGPTLTVVYGENGAGKSGYTRILKLACRARVRDDILGDVLSGSAPTKARATIGYTSGTEDIDAPWTSGIEPIDALASVSVFDAQCVPAYLKNKTDVAFRPFGLDIFDALASVCADVKTRLEAELSTLTSTTFVAPPGLAEGTRAKTLVTGLSALTNEADVRTLTALTAAEATRLEQLKAQQKDLASRDPKGRAAELKAKADRLDVLAAHVTAVYAAVGASAFASLHNANVRKQAATAALESLRKAGLSSELLPATGTRPWLSLWQAAEGYSSAAYPNRAFPVTTAGSKCLLCQQPIGGDAAARFKQLLEFATSTAQADFNAAERSRAASLAAVQAPPARRDGLELLLEDLSKEEDELATRMRNLLRDAAERQDTASGDGPYASVDLDAKHKADLAAAIERLRERARQLLTTAPAMSPEERTELGELEARVALEPYTEAMIAEIYRRRRIGALNACIGETSTLQITKCSTELTKLMVTDTLAQTLKRELALLEFTHLDVEIRPAGGSKGALLHQLVFTNAPGVKVTDVLSEGESRALSLAAFMTELATAPTKSAIIFDDPVSSLDHLWRVRIAKRLVSESASRQVIVFTHDLFFLKTLLSECDASALTLHHQYLRREGQAGISSPELPWAAMNVKDRIGTLRQKVQAATKIHRTVGQTSYEPVARDIFALLREAWERGVTEVMLNDVVERYRPSIETQRARKLHDITEQDCKDVETGMRECSRWMRGHDEAAADGTPVPSPVELAKRLEEFDTWVKRFKQRR